MANKNNEYCCMCGSKKDEVDKLIKGKYGYICDSCILYELHECHV